MLYCAHKGLQYSLAGVPAEEGTLNGRQNTRNLSTNALLFLFALFFSMLILFVFIFAIALGFTSHEVHYAQAIPNGPHTQPFQRITAVTNDQDIYLQPKGKDFFYDVIHENDFTTHFTSDMFFQGRGILSMLCKDDSADIYRVDITLDDNSSLFGDGCNVVELRLEQSDHSIVELGTPEYLAHPHDYSQSYWFPVWGICSGSTLLTILVWWLPFAYRKRKTSLALVAQPDDVQTARFNRQQMLKRVRAIWIDGVLEHSLHQAALQELSLPDPHWDLAVQPAFLPPDDLAMKAMIVKLIAQRAERSLAAGAATGPTIVKFYDQVKEKVLILGQPGSGKTTLLLQLASELLARAEEEEHYLLPVILPLGSWRSRHTTLADWMEEELRERYHVPKDVAHAWVEEKQLVPLLDDLDELPLNRRKECSSVLATESLTWPAMVVCARSMAGLTPLNFLTTLKIQPLTSQQIDAYLVSGGSKLEALRVALRDDSGLQEIASTPSMLTILALTYQNTPIRELPPVEAPEANISWPPTPNNAWRALQGRIRRRWPSSRATLPGWPANSKRTGGGITLLIMDTNTRSSSSKISIQPGSTHDAPPESTAGCLRWSSCCPLWFSASSNSPCFPQLPIIFLPSLDMNATRFAFTPSVLL
jgi:energy-coupling factor transporter ATP-binding protein EcfA2